MRSRLLCALLRCEVTGLAALACSSAKGHNAPGMQVTVLNSGFHGVEPWNFGSRTIKGRVAAKRSLDKTASQIKAEAPAEGGIEAATAALEAPAVDLTEAVASPVRRVPPKKSGGVRKGTGSKATGKKPAVVQICRDCGQVTGFP